MIQSIRWRIGLYVFVVIGALHVGFSALILTHIHRTNRAEIDDHLLEELAQTLSLVGSPDLETFVRSEEAQNNKWNEAFFEVRDASGQVVIASRNVPAGGFGEVTEPQRLGWRHRREPMPPVQVWERVHPASKKGHVRIRIAEARKGDYTVRLGLTLKRKQKAYWRFREQLLSSLVIVGLLASACAWWVARRSLAPIQAITNQAQLLGGTSEGVLPRTGSGDELDRLAQVLNQMLDRIRTEMQRVRRMSADAAHALRTPLAGIRGTLELHLRRVKPGEAEELLPALEGLDETVQFVNRLLLLERLEGTAPDRTRWRDLKLDALVHDLVDAMAIVAQDRHLDLKSQTEPLTVFGDATQLRNAILNLIDNALRHTPQGGRVDVSVQRVGDFAQVAVQDSGPGLRPEQVERAFERYHSDREDGVVGGLGLPIARAVAQAHGGSLDVNREVLSRFELRLPLSSLRVIE